MIDSFEGTGVDAVIINAAGCGHTLKQYGHILKMTGISGKGKGICR